MKKYLGTAGIVACLALTACTSMGSVSQMHDTRMRMDHGNLSNVAPTNYGSRPRANQTMAAPIDGNPNSVPANENTTMRTAKPAMTTHGNASTVAMEDAPANPQPAATSGNSNPPAMGNTWNIGN